MTEPQAPTLPPIFRRLAWSNLAAQSAEQIGLAATPIIAVVALGAGAGETGLLQVAQTSPFVLLAIPVGVLVDRTSKARLMAVAEAMRALSLIAVLVLAVLGQLTLVSLGVLGFVGACGTVAYSIAAPSLVPSLVPPHALPLANGRIELARTVAFAAGPALGGALVGWAGAPAAFALATALSLVAVSTLARIPEGPRPARSEKHPGRDIVEGAAFVAGHGLLRPMFAIQIVFNTALFLDQAIYVPYAHAKLGLSSTGIGFTLAAYGIGMVVGALASPRLMRRARFGAVIGIGPLSALLGSIVLASTIWVPWPALAALAWFLFGVGPTFWVISTTTLRQAVTPGQLLGRVSAIVMLTWGARPLGAGIGALVGARYGEETCLVLGAILFVIQATLVLVSPLVRLRERPPMVDGLPPGTAQPLRPAR